MVSRRMTHVLQIVVFATGPNTFLRRHSPRVGAFLFLKKYPLKLDHTGIGEKKRRVLMGYQ